VDFGVEQRAMSKLGKFPELTSWLTLTCAWKNRLLVAMLNRLTSLKNEAVKQSNR